MPTLPDIRAVLADNAIRDTLTEEDAAFMQAVRNAVVPTFRPLTAAERLAQLQRSSIEFTTEEVLGPSIGHVGGLDRVDFY